jgi:chemotaxis-related protein WspB
MLCLLFQVAGCKYAVEVARVTQVVPRIGLRPLPQAPAYLAGLFDHGGQVVPVLDLGVLFNSYPCAQRLSTRIILVEVPGSGGHGARRLGLIAENVTEIRPAPLTSDDAAPPEGSPHPDRPVLGRILQLDGDLVQMVRVENLLADDVRDRLFGTVLEGAAL